MDFKLRFSFVLFVTAGLFLASCTYVPSNKDDKFIIGEKVTGISKMNRVDGNDSTHLALFDANVQRIHQFSVSPFRYDRSLAVKNPGDTHYVLSDDDGRYVIDLSRKNISVFPQSGAAVFNPVQLYGNPVSAAYRSDLGLAVIYDDLQNVAILKLDPSGRILQKTQLGPVISSSVSIASGDLNENGQLILALSDSSIAIIDVQATLDTDHWQKTIVATPSLTVIHWLAALRGHPNLVLVSVTNKVAVLDITTGIVMSIFDTSSMQTEKLSKAVDPHAILRTVSGGLTNQLTLVYFDGTSLQSRTLFKQNSRLLTSQLNVAQDIWSSTQSDYEVTNIFNDIDEVKNSRQLNRYRLSDLRALNEVSIPDQVKVELSSGFVFSLFPAPLGLAVIDSVVSDQRQELRGFNMHIIHGDE